MSLVHSLVSDIGGSGLRSANIAKRVLFLVERPAPDVDGEMDAMAAVASVGH
jgi:hypothetical protein